MLGARRSASSSSGIALAAALVSAFAAPSAAAVDLVGTWYLLVHYKDSDTANPETWRWDDRVWKFEPKGSRLHWVEYPIVVFNDESGRFEGRHRVLGAWEPNEAQQIEVRSGLQVNSRGSKSKSLRSAKSGKEFQTVGSMQVTSASSVGYFEDWNIAGLPDRPVFTRTDSLGSARAEGMEGLTRWTTTEVLDGGNELRGSFERDESRRGVFRMVRSGDTRGIETAAKTPEERFEKERQRVMLGIQQQAAQEARLGGEEGSGPVLGATLAQVLEAVREGPDEDTQVLVSKLAIFRTDGGEWKELSEDQALGASAQGGDWAVAIHRSCRSTDAVERFQWTSLDWFLLPANAVKAFQYYELRPDCMHGFHFQPAQAELVPVEDRLTDWLAKSFPGGNVHKSDYFRRGIAYAAVGRLDKAEAMLRAGDDAIEIGARTGTIARSDAPGPTPRSITASDDETLRQTLVDDLRRKGVKVDDETSAKR